MIIKSRNKLDKFSIPVIFIDLLLYLFMGFAIFYGTPLFVFVMFHAGKRKGGNVDVSELETDILSKIYFGRDDFTATWIILGLVLGLIFSVLITLRKLTKLHLISIELKDDKMILHYCNILGRENKKEIIMIPNCIKFKFKNETETADTVIEIIECQSGKRILSTNKNKYWEYKRDSQALIELFEFLKIKKYTK